MKPARNHGKASNPFAARNFDNKMKNARVETDQSVVNVYVHTPVLSADRKTAVVLIVMDNLQQVYHLKAEHMQTMCGLIRADYHSGAGV